MKHWEKDRHRIYTSSVFIVQVCAFIMSHATVVFHDTYIQLHVLFCRRSTSWEAVNKVRCMLRTVVKDLPPPRSRVPWRSMMEKQITQRYIQQQVNKINFSMYKYHIVGNFQRSSNFHGWGRSLPLFS